MAGQNAIGGAGLRDVTNTVLPFDRNIDKAIKEIGLDEESERFAGSPSPFSESKYDDQHRKSAESSHQCSSERCSQSSSTYSPQSRQRRLMSRLGEIGFTPRASRHAALRCNSTPSAVRFILDHEELEKKASSRTFECAICMRGDLLADEILTLSCEHRFCAMCLNDWVQMKLKSPLCSLGPEKRVLLP